MGGEKRPFPLRSTGQQSRTQVTPAITTSLERSLDSSGTRHCRCLLLENIMRRIQLEPHDGAKAQQGEHRDKRRVVAARVGDETRRRPTRQTTAELALRPADSARSWMSSASLNVATLIPNDGRRSQVVQHLAAARNRERVAGSLTGLHVIPLPIQLFDVATFPRMQPPS